MSNTPAKSPTLLPVLIGSCGGINPAGRTGAFQGYGFMIRDTLPAQERAQLVLQQARLMNKIRWQENGWVDETGKRLSPGDIAAQFDLQLNDHCFIRRPDAARYFDPYASPVHRRVVLEEGDVLWPRKTLPQPLPEGWTVVGEDPENRLVRIRVSHTTEIFIPHTEKLDVSCAGMIPDGVNLNGKGFGTKGDKIPHGLKLALFGASDAMKSLGLSFAQISERVPQNEIGLYIASAMGQLDSHGMAGYFQAALLDRHPASTCVPFSLNNMAADFVAAYALGSLGQISCEVGACATFLVNLHNAVRDIRSGKIRFAVVGAMDAPVVPWVVSAYSAMKALGRDERLAKKSITTTDGRTVEDLDRSRVSIPFGDNFGFTLAEGSQFVTLFHPDLAVELGVEPLGSIGEVFCHADGWKGSISKPGIGNYVTFGRALRSIERDVGSEILARSYISAHGSSTPQNRQTESQMFDAFAKLFELHNWPVTALKSWLGHTLGPASGDQLNAALASFRYKTLCKIRNLDHIPDDVHRTRLQFCQEHMKDRDFLCCILNSKGFGGHNATGAVYAPDIAKKWLASKLSDVEQKNYLRRCESVNAAKQAWEKAFLEGAEMIDYDATHGYDESSIEELSRDGMKVRGLNPRIEF